MRAAFSTELVRLAKADPNVLLLTGDHGYALFDEFRRECPDQYINCGIAEQNMVGMAAGLAKTGFRPFVYGLAAFIPIRVIEQIKIDIAHDNLPVVLIGDGAGLVYSQLGTSHQSTEDIACVRSIPNVTVLSPADRFEMTACMKLATRLASPVYIRMGKSDVGDIHTEPVHLEAGELLKIRNGNNGIAILATGSMVKVAIDMADQAIDAEIWSAPSIKPICKTQLNNISNKNKYLVTIEEHSTIGGLGSNISEILAATKTNKILLLGLSDDFTNECGSWVHAKNKRGINEKKLKETICNFFDN